MSQFVEHHTFPPRPHLVNRHRDDSVGVMGSRSALPLTNANWCRIKVLQIREFQYVVDVTLDRRDVCEPQLRGYLNL